MSEYWKSTPKYECKCCRIWIPDTKIARATHEAGVKHKEKFEFFNKKKRDEKFHADREQKSLQRQLADIDALAREAVRGDRAQGISGMVFSSSGIAPANGSLHAPRRADNATIDGEGGERPPIDNGMYTVRDQSYLEGKINERYIVKGMGCEIFVEESDEWFRCSVTARREVIIPNTNLKIVSLDVEYYILDGGGSALGDLRTETNIRADRLRLLCDPSGRVMDLNAPPPAEEPPAHNSLFVVHENRDGQCGAGAWTTVSVIEYNEEEQEREAAAALVDEQCADELKRLQEREAAVAFAEREDDVLAQHDPYMTNVYKGVRLATDTVALADTLDIAAPRAGGAATFKKRKVGGGGAVRIKSEDA